MTIVRLMVPPYYVLHRPPPPPYQTKRTQLSLLPIEAYSPPTQPRPNLNAVPHIRPKQYNTIQHKVTIQYKYKVTQRNRAQTAPPDCAQTRLKSDQKTTPTSDPVYLSEQPLHHIRVAKRHSCYTDNKLSLIFDPKKRVICD